MPKNKFELTTKLDKADLVIFPGGEDVHPSIYGERAHPATGPNLVRDLQEMKIYRRAVLLGKPMLGICRGSQFLCAMQPKGRLVQHQQNRYLHEITTFDNKKLEVNSTHHQAQYPFDMDSDTYKILGWSENVSLFHQDGEEKELAPEKECEIVFYPRANALGVQHHPELLDYDHTSNRWLRALLDKFLNKEL